jgi:hypothetical protein
LTQNAEKSDGQNRNGVKALSFVARALCGVWVARRVYLRPNAAHITMARLLLRRLSSSPTTDSLTPLLKALGHTPCNPAMRKGLHPLVEPLAQTTSGDVLGLMRWPLEGGKVHVVHTRPQVERGASEDEKLRSLTVRPCGSVAQFARRAAVEADEGGADGASAVIEAAAKATAAASGKVYVPGELAESRLRISQFLLMRVGPFADMWEQLACAQLDKGDETAALIAAERASSLNPGWGCTLYLQARLMGKLGRAEEQRDLALAALESPFWTLGAPLQEAMGAAQLAHIEDLRELIRAMEDKVREQQGAPARTARENALMRATDALDGVVRTDGSWDDVRPVVAEALREAGMQEAAAVASVGSE